MEEKLDKMRELRTFRDLQILKSELDNINLDVDYQKKLSNHKVKDVKYLGKIEMLKNIDDKDVETLVDVFSLIEQIEVKNSNGDIELKEIEKYYTEDFDLLAVENKEFGLLLEKEYIDKKEIVTRFKKFR